MALTAIAAPVAAAQPVYPDGSTDAIVVEVVWDDRNVTSGETANLAIENVTAGTTADTATVTVRNASGTDTYWLPGSEYNFTTTSTASTEVDVVLENSALGSVSLLDISPVTASSTLEVGPGESVSANISADDGLPAEYQPLAPEVTILDGTTDLNSTTVDVDNSSASFAEVNLNLENSTNVTVVATGATADNGETVLGAISAFNVSTFGNAVGAGGGGSDGSTDRPTIYVIGAAVIAAGGYIAPKGG